ncbi:MAG: hypothetical protein M5U26_11270 [Planctomycetota bacterium]|nr:hypothetical protein [Planctomycetota bacterium]
MRNLRRIAARVEAGDFAPPAARFPRRAEGACARAIGEDLAELSKPFGTALAWRGGRLEALIGTS